MFKDKPFSLLLTVQGVYILVTALWALVDIDSFMWVSGPKTDIWLVKTVAVVLVSIGLALLFAVRERQPPLSIKVLGLTNAAGLAVIDFYYTSNGTIKWVYAADGVLQVFIIIAWIILIVKNQQPVSK
jgi:anti-sigma-K factor RskA